MFGHRFKKICLSRLSDFRDDEDGAMIVLALFFFIIMMIVMGLSIDLMRYELYRSRIQSTMDRALLAAAHPDQEHDRKEVVLDYFERAGLGSVIEKSDIEVEERIGGTLVKATASGYIGTPFMNFMSTEDPVYLKPSASGAAMKTNQLTEVSLVLDVSGSMAWRSVTGRTRLYEMTEAAKDFVNLLLCDPNDPDEMYDCTVDDYKTSVSMVPYSTQVNVGKDLLKHFERTDKQDYGYCTTFMDEDFNVPYIKVDGTGSGNGLRQAAKFVRYGGNYKGSTNTAYLSCHPYEWIQVAPFEHSAELLNDKLEGLKAMGDTAIDIGMKWGAALLHHEAEPAISGMVAEGLVDDHFQGRPYNPGDVKSAKFIVLMTDGQNTNHHHLFDGYRTGPSPFWLNTYAGRDIISVKQSENRYLWYYPQLNRSIYKDHPYGENGRRDCFQTYRGNMCTPKTSASNSYTKRLSYEEFWSKNYTWSFFQRFGWLGTPGRLISNSKDSDRDGVYDIDERLIAQCDAAKKAGITIYTIMMEATVGQTMKAMEECASVRGGQKLHFVTTGLNVSTLFSKIAKDINKLRLVE